MLHTEILRTALALVAESARSGNYQAWLALYPVRFDAGVDDPDADYYETPGDILDGFLADTEAQIANASDPQLRSYYEAARLRLDPLEPHEGWVNLPAVDAL